MQYKLMMVFLSVAIVAELFLFGLIIKTVINEYEANKAHESNTVTIGKGLSSQEIHQFMLKNVNALSELANKKEKHND